LRIPFTGVTQMQLYKKGKVKEVYEASEGEFEFHFTDQISVFDKVIPTPDSESARIS
jgi:phosphoribosylaminoimidazole-succinocarboxamide synthase